VTADIRQQTADIKRKTVMGDRTLFLFRTVFKILNFHNSFDKVLQLFKKFKMETDFKFFEKLEINNQEQTEITPYFMHLMSHNIA
jgi:hypothetical protein